MTNCMQDEKRFRLLQNGGPQQKIYVEGFSRAWFLVYFGLLASWGQLELSGAAVPKELVLGYTPIIPSAFVHSSRTTSREVAVYQANVLLASERPVCELYKHHDDLQHSSPL
ncbi:hypothetical protein VTK56DRAFT_3038 [Thermocarpiscus australiensis]